MLWTLLTTPANTCWASSNEDGSILLIVADSTVYKSTNLGVSWVPILTDVAITFYSVEQSPNGQHIVAVGSSGFTNPRIYVSHDYGSSFVDKSPGTYKWGRCDLSDDGQVIAVYAFANSPTPAYTFYTTDGGNTWNSRSHGTTADIDGLAVSGNGSTILHSSFGAYWGVEYSTNSGASWATLYPPIDLGESKGLGVSYDGQFIVSGFSGSGAGRYIISFNGLSSYIVKSGPLSRYGTAIVSADGGVVVLATDYYGAAPNMWFSEDQLTSGGAEGTWEDTGWAWVVHNAELSADGSLIVGTNTVNEVRIGFIPISKDLTLAPIDAQSSLDPLSFAKPLPVAEIPVLSSLGPVTLPFSNPVVVNRAPSPGAIEFASDTIRFGVRDRDRQVLRASIQCYIGYGSAWWGGGVLPEDDERTQFTLLSRVGAPSQPAGRELDGDELVLTKSLIGLQESMYEFGGLQAPANYDAPLMLEFEVGLDSYSVDAQNWTGVFAGLKGANKGIAIKFVDDGAKKIELHSADPASATAIYSVEYDWSVGGTHVFKLLWYPELDLMRLYVSSGPDTTADESLISGAVSAFPDLPADELPNVQPIGFFGHGAFNATSVSRWASIHLYNEVARALVDGIPRGGHDGKFLSVASALYDALDYPRKVTQPWVILPDSFSSIGGEEVLQAGGYLTLRRTSYGESLGFYREEPKVSAGPTILDFRMRGSITDRPPGDGPESGIEVYVDDGTKMAAVEFLDSGGEQSVGLRDGPSDLSGWLVDKRYRLIVDPLAAARMMALGETEDGIVEVEFVGINYSFLPASELPGPGIGFLHNANVVQARGELHLSWLKYSLDARMWEGVYGMPASPWNLFGTGSPTLAGDILTIDDQNDGDGANDRLGYSRAETRSDNVGLYVEAICRVGTYTKDELVDQDRTVTGVGFAIDDDLVQYELMFAEAGPEFGKIAFLTTDEDRDQNLINICARRAQVRGTYFAVDWTKFHHYRIERVVGGDIAIFLDWGTRPVIQVPWDEFNAIVSTEEGVRFGSLLTDRKTTSQWQSVRYGISSGWDVEALSNDGGLRYENAVNVLVEVDS